MAIELIGWDIGGAHLKAAALEETGQFAAVVQEACPLWQGLDRLRAAFAAIRERWAPGPGCRHAVTMTGELADCFPSREAGVAALLGAMSDFWPDSCILVFAGPAGFLPPDRVGPEHVPAIASANWLATGLLTAATLPEALFVDVGSTTTDILPIAAHRAVHRGYSDEERMRYDELLYTGVVRTPLMALARRAPLGGAWLGLMAEHFATTADVYRLTGELPEAADQHPAADRGPKTPAGSRRRLARMFGRDADSLPPELWRRAALYFRERQLIQIREGLELQLSRGLPGAEAPVVGAGVGRFLVREVAQRMHMDYLDFSTLLSPLNAPHGFDIDDCAPACAVARLALNEVDAP